MKEYVSRMSKKKKARLTLVPQAPCVTALGYARWVEYAVEGYGGNRLRMLYDEGDGKGPYVETDPDAAEGTRVESRIDDYAAEERVRSLYEDAGLEPPEDDPSEEIWDYARADVLTGCAEWLARELGLGLDARLLDEGRPKSFEELALAQAVAAG